MNMKCAEGQNFKIDIVLLAGGCLRQTELLSADHHITTVPDISSYEIIRCRNFKAMRTLGQHMAGGAHPHQQVAFIKHIKRSECRASNDRKQYSCINQVSYGIGTRSRCRDTAELEIFYLNKAEYIHGIWTINDAGKDTLDMAMLLNRKGPRASLWLQGQIL